jgi:hypothetical protein
MILKMQLFSIFNEENRDTGNMNGLSLNVLLINYTAVVALARV